MYLTCTSPVFQSRLYSFVKILLKFIICSSIKILISYLFSFQVQIFHFLRSSYQFVRKRVPQIPLLILIEWYNCRRIHAYLQEYVLIISVDP